MPRGVDAAGGEVVAAVAMVVCWVPDEGTWHGARHELVSRCCRRVGEAEGAEHTQLVVGGWDAEQELKWCLGGGGVAQSSIDEVRGGGERSAQNEVDAPLWMSRVRRQSLRVRRVRFAFPFYWEVYGQESRRATPCVERKKRNAVESNSFPLSVCKASKRKPNCVPI
jgi:hypothetical protein